MYLKSIEIQGFKSFANKIRLEFQPGFTGIVGPNGSGKSNIADAVRWVLGEQRIKQLRGGSMQDVIFSGTQLRKPLSFAYVSITMDNSDHILPVDYQEVTVARRLYRSGESEYILNGTNVRLRDVQELFMDTGIGKEGYSIIGQGQIERILSDKPEERRELFDEAAGIVKFKHRKDESLKKLEAEQNNLIRVNDILSELEKQVGPLEKQARKAQDFLSLREELKRLDVNAFLVENQRAEKELATLKNQVQTDQSNLEDAMQTLEESRSSFEQIGTQIHETDKEIESIRNQITQISIVRNKQENDIKILEEQIRSAMSDTSHYEERKAQLSGEIETRKKEHTAALQAKAAADASITEILARRDKASQQLLQTQQQENALSSRVENLRNKSLDLINQQAQRKARKASLETSMEQLVSRKTKLEELLSSASIDEAGQSVRIKELEDQAARVKKEQEDLRLQQLHLDNALQDKKQQLSSLDETLKQTQEAYHQAKSRLEALTNLTERYEGFGNSVRHVMEHKNTESGLIGVVADLIKTEPRYENAIEVALGGNIQNVVTRDEATAKRMIALLKKDHAGRATFLPLSNISNAQNFSTPGILHEPGMIGMADTLVSIRPEYQAVGHFLLGRIVVADTFDHAAAALNKYGHKCRMVTLEGELFSPGGAISGGAYRNSSNLLGRRREMAELSARSDSLRQQIQNIQTSIDHTKSERNVIRAKMETFRMQQQNKVLDLNRLQLLSRQEAEKQENAREEYISLQKEMSSLEGQSLSITSKEKEIDEFLEAIKSDQEKNQTQIKALQEELKSFHDDEEEKRQALSTIDLELEKARSSASFQQETQERVAKELQRLTSEAKEIDANLHNDSFSVQERKEKIKAAREDIASATIREEACHKDLEEKNKEKDSLSAQQAELLKKRENLSDEKTALDKEIFRLNTRIEQMEDSLESQAGYIWTQYQLTLSQAQALRDESLSNINAMKAAIKDKKEKINALGSVNVNAIEEYTEVSSRYLFMKSQRDDLVKAASSLQKIIDDLDENMRRQFKEQFGRIQQEFDKVFKQLFGGGSGKLELMEGEDLLTAGVRVIAQPPGKKLVNMMQMSGGEKALTAISLLFAIQNLKPSPFCLLDEIEAALDESNVTRFADYIHTLTSHTQFIVITHRRGTMDRADRLYGITMQEKGVSTLVSVNLIDEKDLTA